jgi:hypothetical protein
VAPAIGKRVTVIDHPDGRLSLRCNVFEIRFGEVAVQIRLGDMLVAKE